MHHWKYVASLADNCMSARTIALGDTRKSLEHRARLITGSLLCDAPGGCSQFFLFTCIWFAILIRLGKHPREPNKNLGVNCARTFGAKDCGSVWDAVLLTKTAKYGGCEQSRNLIALFVCMKINDLIHTASSSSIFHQTQQKQRFVSYSADIAPVPQHAFRGAIWLMQRV